MKTFLCRALIFLWLVDLVLQSVMAFALSDLNVTGNMLINTPHPLV
jgi:cell division septal protein FtsQ